MKFYIGCSGYFYWNWKGKFYPSELKPSQWFDYYSKIFNTVEINSTFYNFPKEKNLKNWYKKSPDNFVFSVKVHRSITHIKKLVDVKDMLDNFYSSIKNSLKEKLGAVLFQLPPSYRYSKENMERIASVINQDFINVVEFRDRDWWNDEVYQFLKEKNITFCSVSAPDLPEDLIKTSSNIYLRFHGKENWYRYRYTDNELINWSKKILEKDADSCFIYFNNDYNAYAPDNAIRLKELIDKYKK